MRGPLGHEHITELVARARTPAQHRSAAERLRAWAGGRDGALLALREAVAAEGGAPSGTRCYLHGELLGAGLREEADEPAREVRRSRPTGSVSTAAPAGARAAGSRARRGASGGWTRDRRRVPAVLGAGPGRTLTGAAGPGGR